MTELPTALQALADAGVPLDAIAADHLEALAGLDDAQLAAVVGVLEVVVPEVEGFVRKKKVAPGPLPNPAPMMMSGGTKALPSLPSLGNIGDLGLKS